MLRVIRHHAGTPVRESAVAPVLVHRHSQEASFGSKFLYFNNFDISVVHIYVETMFQLV